MDLVKFVLDKLYHKNTSTISASSATDVVKSTKEQEQLLKVGVSSSQLQKMLDDMTITSYDRRNLYISIEKSLPHPLMGAAPEIFADTATTKSHTNNCSIWVTSQNRDYQYEIDKLFELINLEEVIYDWSYCIALYGDLFLDIEYQPGVGIIGVSDTTHPINTARLDYNGRLIGFVNLEDGLTPVGKSRDLLPPYSKVHFRLLQNKLRRVMGNGQDPNYSEYRISSIMSPDNRRVSAKYGTSILTNALITYKRLKMAEDSLLAARILRSRKRNIYKVGVGEGTSSEGAAALIQEYIQELKRENSLDVSGAGKFTSKTNIMNDMEDIILPVFGAANNLQIDQMGGDVDIHYIVDIEELRNQLATALRIPLPLLAGYAKEAPPALGDGSFASLDIRFSRQCYRLQRAIIAGITRLIQLHLAFTGRDPDLNLFEVHMASVSTAEEQAIRESLDKGVEITEKLIALVSTALGEDGYDKLSLLKYANDKFLKLNDLDFKSLVKNVEAATGPLTTPEVKSEDNVFRTNLNMAREQSSDLKAFTVLNESVWKEKYSGIKIEVGGEA